MKRPILSRISYLFLCLQYCFFMALLSSLSTAALAQDTLTVKIGDTEILLPKIEHFSDPTNLFPALKTLGETMTARSNKLLAFYVADENIVNAINGNKPALERYFMIQTLRNKDNNVVTKEDFITVREFLKKNYESLLSKAGPGVQKELDIASKNVEKEFGAKEVSIKIGEIKFIEIFDERDDALSALAITMVQGSTEGVTKNYPLAITISNIRVNGKIIYFAAYSKFSDENDYDWLKQQTNAWVSKVLEINQKKT